MLASTVPVARELVAYRLLMLTSGEATTSVRAESEGLSAARVELERDHLEGESRERS